ncbi:hypothetical protein GWI33_002296, partial [Rhynchophorus ferrugineus]
MTYHLGLISIFLLAGLRSIHGQADSGALYFPSESKAVQNENLPLMPAPAIVPQYNSAPLQYQSFVNQLISVAIANVTLSINRLMPPRSRSNENLVFSPISITAALALVLLGSNGETFNEISRVLGLQAGISDIDYRSQFFHERFSDLLDKLVATAGFQLGHDVRVANALFVQDTYPIRELYKNVANALYEASVVNVDFQNDPTNAGNVINEWVARSTRGKIRQLLAADPPRETTVILSSALYFMAEWERPFFEHSTKRRPFYPDGRKSPTDIEVDMMANGGLFPYFRDRRLGCEILGFPYKGNRSTMYVVMPVNSSKDNLERILSTLTIDDLEQLVSHTVLTEVITVFPKMIIESTIDLEDTLKQMGIKSLFNPRESNLALLGDIKPTYNNAVTNFTKNIKNYDVNSIDTIRQLINQQSRDNSYLNPGLYADQVIHKVYVDINEKGTE